MTEKMGAGPGIAPMPGEPPPNASAPGLAPAPVSNAVRFMFVRAALGVVGVIVTLATKEDLKTRIRERNSALDEAKLDVAVNVGLAIGIVFGIVFIAAYVLLALKVRAGRGWARIVTWVLAGLGIVFGLLALVQPAPAISKAFSLISVVVDIAIVVLLARRPASDYFSKTA